MNSRRHLRNALRLIASGFLLTAIGGCAASHHASPGNAPTAGKSPADSSATTRPDTMDAANINAADLLTHQTQQYSQKMESAIARHSAQTNGLPNGAAGADVAASAAPPTQPSLVQWGETNDTHLSLLPGYLLRPQSSPAPSALIAAAPSDANPALAQLASMRTGAISNTSASVTTDTPTHDTTRDTAHEATHDAQPDRAKSQIASLTPSQSEVITDGSSDSQSAALDSSGSLGPKLAKRAREYPHDVSAQLDYQVFQFLMDEQVPNLANISALPDEDREMLSAVMDGLSMYRNNLRADNNMLLSRKVQPLLQMSDRLRALADLTIPTVALCREVHGFANYTPFEGDPPHFAAGKEHKVILYCEVQNFSSQLNDAKLWQTALVQDAVLYTEGGMSAWNDKSQAVNDSARNRRQDFFIIQKMSFPATLPMGRYLLKVTIEDKQSHHVAEATQPLLIMAE